MIEVPLVFALELAVLYLAGSYMMARLAGLLGFRGGDAGLGRVAFYLLVLPGVTLHEAAHYLACLLTGTRVSRFLPFWPHRSASGRLLLGYVRHERRPFPIEALIGLAPILLNPLGSLLVTALLTPLTLAQVTDPQVEVVKEVVLTSGFLTGRPASAATHRPRRPRVASPHPSGLAAASASARASNPGCESIGWWPVGSSTKRSALLAYSRCASRGVARSSAHTT
jgi:hypothetical protein